MKLKELQLHYLEGEILVDFYLSVDYLDNNEISTINFDLSEIIKKLPGFGEVKVYFS